MCSIDWSSDVCSSDLDLCSLPRQSQHGLPRGRERHLQAVAIAEGAAWHRSVDGGRMSSAGGRRRSLLANAIESIGTTPPPTRAADGPVAGDHADREKPAEEPATPSFLERRVVAFDEIARTFKGLTLRLTACERPSWPGNTRYHAALNYN